MACKPGDEIYLSRVIAMRLLCNIKKKKHQLLAVPYVRAVPTDTGYENANCKVPGVVYYMQCTNYVLPNQPLTTHHGSGRETQHSAEKEQTRSLQVL
jgi:hypothetical protein